MNPIKEKEPQQKSTWIVIILVIVILGFFSFIVAGIFSLFLMEPVQAQGNVVVIPLRGEISVDSAGGYFTESGASSHVLVDQLEQARDDPMVRAVILDINSPGGSAVASSEIANAVKEVEAANKTVVAVIREVGASGAYWIASSSDYIIAHDLSITGSIGVISSYLEFSGILNDHNITYRRLVSGERKDMGTPLRELTSEEQAIFQQKLDYIHDAFIREVATNRGLAYEDVVTVADGSFMLGGEALQFGLIDQLGGRKEAVAYIEQVQGITAEVVEYEEEKGLLQLLSEIASKQSFSIGEGIGAAIVRSQDSSSVLRV